MKVVARAIQASAWIPTAPTLKQLQLLAATEREVLYGGQVGGGKSEALLMDAALFVDEPGYSALLLRRTFADLALPDALMDRAQKWWANSPAKWREQEKTWEFPSGATVTFGYLDGPRDYLRYQGAAFQRVYIDESTQIREHDIKYLFSRMRRTTASRVPVVMRLASNPGGESHGYHVENFVEPRKHDPQRRFIPAGLEDNPHLDTQEYEESLANLDEITYRQLRGGEWIEGVGDNPFKPEWFRGQSRYRAEDAPSMWSASVGRYIALDTANTSRESSAYSALVVGDVQRDYTMPIRYVARERLEFPELIEWTVQEIAPFVADGKLRGVLIENAASGTQLIQTLRASGPKWLRPLITSVQPNKGTAAQPGKQLGWRRASVWANRGMILLPEPGDGFPWLYDFEREVFTAPNSPHYDQIDALSMLVNYLERSQAVFSTRWLRIGGKSVA